VFLLGLFTVVRLVDVTLEHQRFLTGIAHIRGYYRTLTPEAAEYFAAERGRWPEAPSSPALQLGANISLLTTTATMVAFINNVVAGVGVTLLARWLLGPHRTLVAVFIGVVTTAILVGVFYAYQRWRFSLAQRTAPPPDQTPATP